MVRLKGGDPFIFGRGEELETLCEAGIPFSVVPALPPPPAAPLIRGSLDPPRFRAGRPPVTGHLKTGGELDWANGGGEANRCSTWVEPAAIREKLIAHGMAEDMPAAIVENGTAVTQKWSAAP